MTFREATNLSVPILSVLGKTSSVFSNGTFQSRGAPSGIGRGLLAAAAVSAGLFAVVSFGVGAWTIGGWIFGSEAETAQIAESSPPAKSSPPKAVTAENPARGTAERLIVMASNEAEQPLPVEPKPEITQTAALQDIAGTDEKLTDEKLSEQEPAVNAEAPASAEEEVVDNADAAKASDVAVQYAEALAGFRSEDQSAKDDSLAVTTPAEDSIAALLKPRTVTVARGDTLMALMVGAGADRSDAHEAIAALRDVYSPRRLRPGQEIELTFATINPLDDEEANAQGSTDDTAGGGQLMGLSLQSAVDEIVRVARAAVSDDFVAETIERPLERQVLHGSGTIDSSLFVAARNAGIPNRVMIELMRAFSYDVDFQREIQPGDSFDLVYEVFYDEDGKVAKTGNILVAGLSLSGTPLTLYNYTPASGFNDFFDEKGQAVRKALMRTPIDGARLSSGFGKRKHPILGYTKMHKGLDFAAPRGTPIYAAGDGVIERIGRWGAYGKYIRIRHHSSYKTAYAHLKGYAKGMKKGKRVKQGQVIGYVGSTGRSTGPHLHYEVLLNNKQVNPRKIKLPSGEKLKGKDLKNYQAHRTEVDALREAIIAGKAQMVQAKPSDCASQGTIDESGATQLEATSDSGC